MSQSVTNLGIELLSQLKMVGLYTQQIPEQKIYWKIFYHKFTDQVDHKFMENLTKNI